MVQFGLLIVAVVLMNIGVNGLTGEETSDRKTPKGVAIATVAVGWALAAFAFFLSVLV